MNEESTIVEPTDNGSQDVTPPVDGSNDDDGDTYTDADLEFFRGEGLQHLWGEEYKEDPSFKDFKSFDDFAKSYKHLKGIVGKKGVIIPGENATEEDWNTYYGQLGRPDSPEGYKFESSDIPEELNNEKMKQWEKDFRGKAHSLGLNMKQAEGLYQYLMGNSLSNYKTTTENRRKNMESAWNDLRTENGKDHEAKMNIASKVFGLLDEKDINFLKSTGLSKNANLVRIAQKLGESMLDDTIELDSVAPAFRTAKSAQRELAQLKEEALNNREHPLNNKSHPQYWDMVERWNKLQKEAYGDVQ